MQKLFFLFLFGAIVLSSGMPLEEYEVVEIPDSSIAKRSLKTDFGTPLTGMERITRSLKTEENFAPAGMERISKRAVFLPGFSRHRQVRSVDLDRERRQIFLPGFARSRRVRSVEEPDEESGRQRRYVFLPAFARHRHARSTDYINDVLDSNDVFKREKRHVFLPSFALRRQGRSVPEEDMDTAETAVFLPGFARRG